MHIPGGSVLRNPAANVGHAGLIPGSGKSPGEGNINPLHYSCLENPMDRGSWWAIVHRVTKSQTKLKWLSKRAYTELMIQMPRAHFCDLPELLQVASLKLDHSTVCVQLWTERHWVWSAWLKQNPHSHMRDLLYWDLETENAGWELSTKTCYIHTTISDGFKIWTWPSSS